MMKHFKLWIFGLVCVVLVSAATAISVGAIFSTEPNDTARETALNSICEENSEESVCVETYKPSLVGEINSENSTRFDGRIVENGEESCFNGIIMNHALDDTIEEFINEGWEYDPNNDVWVNGDKFLYIESDSRSSTVTE